VLDSLGEVTKENAPNIKKSLEAQANAGKNTTYIPKSDGAFGEYDSVKNRAEVVKHLKQVVVLIQSEHDALVKDRS
jgi:hypothetical protein